METSNSGANHAVLHAQNERRCLGLIETINSGHNVAVLNPKNIGEVWDLYRLLILVQKSLFCIQKPQMRPGTYRN